MDWAFLAVTGFLLGSVLYTGWYTIRYEPEAKLAYALIGTGVLMVAGVNAYLDFYLDRSNWYRGALMVGYGTVASGLTLLVRSRRRRQ